MGEPGRAGHGLMLRVYGTKGGIHWMQDIRIICIGRLPDSTRMVTRGGPEAGEAAGRVTRVPPGHPEDYLEGFTNIYSEVAAAIKAARTAKPPKSVHFPTIDDGVKGLAFIEAAVKSSKANGKWVTLWARPVDSMAVQPLQ
jgi:predicted dehydrogenase